MNVRTISASASNGRELPQLTALAGIHDFRRGSRGTSAPMTEALNIDRAAASRSACHCGHALTTCPGCESGRCLACDPYSSDDCRYRDL